jgi:hypothetical protein
LRCCRKEPETLTKDGGIAALESNRQSRGKEPLDDQGRSPSKLTVADTERDTTDELLEARTKGASGLHHQRDDRRAFKRRELGVLMNLILFPLPGRAKRA